MSCNNLRLSSIQLQGMPSSPSGPPTLSKERFPQNAGLRKKDLGPKGRTEREQYLWQIAAVAFLAMMGDLYAQIFEGTRYSEYDFGRTARFTLFRAVVAAPVYIYWLSKLDALAEQLSALTGMWPLLIKLLLDQGVYTPIYQVVFFCFLAALEGQPLSEGFRRCLLVLPQSIPVAWCFWLPVQAVCFHIVPLQWRVVYVNVFNIVWNTILSLFNSSASAAPVASMPAEPIETASDLVSMASSVAAASRSASLAAAAAGAAAGDIPGVEAPAEEAATFTTSCRVEAVEEAHAAEATTRTRRCSLGVRGSGPPLLVTRRLLRLRTGLAMGRAQTTGQSNASERSTNATASGCLRAVLGLVGCVNSRRPCRVSRASCLIQHTHTHTHLRKIAAHAPPPHQDKHT